MLKSEALIQELIDAKIITDKLCDKYKAQLIIRHFFCAIHQEAVLATVIATNKKTYVEPQFFD